MDINSDVASCEMESTLATRVVVAQLRLAAAPILSRPISNDRLLWARTLSGLVFLIAVTKRAKADLRSNCGSSEGREKPYFWSGAAAGPTWNLHSKTANGRVNHRGSCRDQPEEVF
ncbi:hypothetical protein PPMP20_02315 [Paraburkholderia phymatum]|uniref:hypothetical protein n=1 Tax=Paraburkholderia phymatum TaxID=148447 RepID=UPI0012FE37D6|nr:hypothetical protein [Paraburkholderia phymatum]